MVINLTILTIDYPAIQLVIIDAGDQSTISTTACKSGNVNWWKNMKICSRVS